MQKKVRPVVDAAACTACIPAAVPAMKPSWRAASPVFVSLSGFVEERGQRSNKRTVR
jgi:hypothetical protein